MQQQQFLKQQQQQQQQLMERRELQQRRMFFDASGQMMPGGMGVGAGMGAPFAGMGMGAGAPFAGLTRFGGLRMPTDPLSTIFNPKFAAQLKLLQLQHALQAQQVMLAFNMQLCGRGGGVLQGDVQGSDRPKVDKTMRGAAAQLAAQASFYQERTRTRTLKAELAELTQKNLLVHSRSYSAGTGGSGPARVPLSPNRMTRGPRMSSSKYRGVSWHKRDKAWVARVWHNNKSEHVGVYTSEERAAIAVDMQLIQYKGVKDAAPLNFPDPVERDRLLQMYCRTGDVERRSTTGGIPSAKSAGALAKATSAEPASVPPPAAVSGTSLSGADSAIPAAGATSTTTTQVEAKPAFGDRAHDDDDDGDGDGEPMRPRASERRDSEATESMSAKTITPTSAKDELAAFATSNVVPETNDEEDDDSLNGTEDRPGAAKRKNENEAGDDNGAYATKRTKTQDDIDISEN
jgi:hypothetical protein